MTNQADNTDCGSHRKYWRRGCRVTGKARRECCTARAQARNTGSQGELDSCRSVVMHRSTIGDADISTLVVDFTDMESVRRAATEALDRFPSIQGLISLFWRPYSKTARPSCPAVTR